ncbi:MAG: undecaprenyl diphosphate synthase family protein [Methanosarcinales archaeon]|nr:undecaprenyl diphosphate synthase family protein [Methanosarcinales archaeon]
MDSIPGHIVLIITESDLIEIDSLDRIMDFVGWCEENNIHILTIYVSMIDLDAAISSKVYDELLEQLTLKLRNIYATIDLFSVNGEIINIKTSEKSKLLINVSMGYGGKKELTKAFKDIMQKVDSRELNPEDINESVIENHLLFNDEPDLVIRSGGKLLTDFLIWQSVYSEIYFTDVSWIQLRKLDFLRAIRDFQKRQRRFGK